MPAGNDKSLTRLCFQPAHRIGPILRMHERPRKSNALQSRLPESPYVFLSYPANGGHGDVHAFMLHLLDDLPIAFQPQYGTKVFLGAGPTVWAQSNVIRPLIIMQAYVLDGIGGAANDKIFPQDHPRLCHGHILLAQMYAIGAHLAGDLYPVIDDQP